MKIAFYTNKGCVRAVNEDALFIGNRAIFGENMMAPSIIETDSDKEIICVIDGLGGYIGGATAAQITARSFETATEHNDNNAWLESILQIASERMREEARNLPNLVNMGATLAGAKINRENKSIFAFNLGDCRLYRFQSGYLDKLTRDHSQVQELFDCGEISENEMRTHSCKNIVTSGVFANETIMPRYFCRSLTFKDEGEFFACSDGVWEALPSEEIEISLSITNIGSACEDLVNKLFAAKCSDNISFIYAKL